ncbi:MAG: alpha-amylase [Agathobacter sp.]|nr:alpha-amylase [Agathobacter sp.]
MAWYDEAIFYHIYPLGMTGAPKQNEYGEPVERLNQILPWISHIKNIGCNAIYIGPLFESVGHGYETTDYKKLDSRLGTNETLKNFVAECHKQGVKVIFDGVFNHTGRDFFAFKDLRENRENSRYKDWYCNVNFWGNNSYNDGFEYENWGGYDLLVKLNQKNPEVINYICDVIRFWVDEFDVDGIRLDAADVLDFDFMKALRRTANEVKPDFWLMGEVIHGDYIRWANADTLHSVTNYHLHKALYSGYNDHNFFEIAHTVKRLNDMCGGVFKLYNFVDNHDVERIMSKLSTPKGFVPVHILLYTLPGVPSIYYGSEFGIEGKKGRGADADAPLRPEMIYEDWTSAMEENAYLKFITALGNMRQQVKALSFGDYKEQNLTTRQYTFSRSYEGSTVVVMVNNDDNACTMHGGAPDGTYTGVLSGKTITVSGGGFSAEIAGNSGEIWVPDVVEGKFETVETVVEDAPAKVKVPVVETVAEPMKEAEPAVEAVVEEVSEPETTEKSVLDEVTEAAQAQEEKLPEVEETAKETKVFDLNKPYEEMSIEELQACILAKMAKNGPVTEEMKRTVDINVHHGSLMNWVRSFN